eukprot:g1712.t1
MSAGIGMFLASTALGGAVATVMPIQTGANLLGNMLWQTLLGMKYYTKSMRVGTIVLICAVMELSEIGPQEPSEWAPEEIQELMTKPEPGLNTGGGMDWDEEGWRHASR